MKTSEYEKVYGVAAERIASALSAFKFVRKESERNAMSMADFYCPEGTEDARYVRIAASLSRIDMPWSILASVGEGDIHMPEVDWNGLPLHLLVKGKGHNAGDYRYDSAAEMEGALQSVEIDLMKYGEDFLLGDLTLFRKLRAELNRSRRPYMRYKQGKRGTLTKKADPESSELRRRFSEE